METREWFKQEIAALGFTFPDSMTNFVFARHNRVSGKELYELLRTQNIFVRHFGDPLIDEYLRITVGTREQMERLLDFLRVYLG